MSAALSPDSEFAGRFPGYSYRAEQAALSTEIADALATGSILLAEAETGTGKTLAYLVPVIKSGQKVLISTHTRALQDQLMFKDMPSVLKALGLERDVALLKGRSNYLCPHRLQQRLRDHRLPASVGRLLLEVRDWSETSRKGDLSSLYFDVFDAGIGTMVTSTAEQCLGRSCPDWDRCPLVQARSGAREADIVITNHSLLLADASLKSGDFGEILPEFDAHILDEAQSLAGLASQHFGLQLGSQRFIHWANDMQATLEETGDEMELQDEVARLLHELLPLYANGGLEEVLPAWQKIEEMAASRADRNQDLATLARRAVEISQHIRAIMQPEKGYVAWLDGEGRSKRHYLAPVETGPLLEKHVWSKEATFILLSASLRVSGRFVYAKSRLGLAEAKETSHNSPFDYGRQALIYVPEALPEPRNPTYPEALLAEMEALISASQGRAFVLFTSHRILECIAPLLAANLPWRVLIQGKDGSRDKILFTFREDTSSILCGTRSFWEGVDVPGDTLSLVIIDKIPFAPPDDPLLKERIRICDERGGNGFRDIQLPEALAILKQGVGRLIRSQTDRGVMALLDSRVYSKVYGREVFRNFPPAPRSKNIKDVQRFFAT